MLDKNNGEFKKEIQDCIKECNIEDFKEFTEDDFTFIKEIIDLPKDIEHGVMFVSLYILYTLL